jgi:hypothetical protein
MDNHNNYPYYFGYGYTKGEGKNKDMNRYGTKENSGRRNDDDLIIEENTIYEIDRDCMERLKRNKRLIVKSN